MAENSKSSRILKAFCMETTLHGWAYLTYDEKVSPKCAKYETNYLPKCFFEIQLCSFIFATGSSDLCGLLLWLAQLLVLVFWLACDLMNFYRKNYF